jgi:hypothetical protein
VAGQPFTIALTDARVPGHPAATAFTSAFDCGTGTYAAATSTPSASCPTTAAGPLAVRTRARCQDFSEHPPSDWRSLDCQHC